MTDSEISPITARLLAENLGLKLLVATLASRMAQEHDEPALFILTLTEPLRAMAEAVKDDDGSLFAAHVMDDLAAYVEERALE